MWQHPHCYPVHHNHLCKTLFSASKVTLRKAAALTFGTSSHKHLSRCRQRATLLGCQYLICSKIKWHVIRPSPSSQGFSADAELDVRKLLSKAYGIFCNVWPLEPHTVSVYAPYRCIAHSTPLFLRRGYINTITPEESPHCSCGQAAWTPSLMW